LRSTPQCPRRWSFSKKRSKISLVPILQLISILVGLILIIYSSRYATIDKYPRNSISIYWFGCSSLELGSSTWMSHMPLPEVLFYQHLETTLQCFQIAKNLVCDIHFIGRFRHLVDSIFQIILHILTNTPYFPPLLTLTLLQVRRI